MEVGIIEELLAVVFLILNLLKTVLVFSFGQRNLD